MAAISVASAVSIGSQVQLVVLSGARSPSGKRICVDLRIAQRFEFFRRPGWGPAVYYRLQSGDWVRESGISGKRYNWASLPDVVREFLVCDLPPPIELTPIKLFRLRWTVLYSDSSTIDELRDDDEDGSVSAAHNAALILLRNGAWILVDLALGEGRPGYCGSRTVSKEEALDFLVNHGYPRPGHPLPEELLELCVPGDVPIPDLSNTSGLQASSGSQVQKLNKEEADAKARMLALRDPDFVHKTLREWAEEIGCSEGLVSELPFWQKVMELSGRGRRNKSTRPMVVSLTEKVQAVTVAQNSKDAQEEFDRLKDEQTKEQRADNLSGRRFVPRRRL